MSVINIKNAPSGFKKIDGDQGGYVFIGRPGFFGNVIRISGQYGNFICPVCGKLHYDAGSTLPCYEKWLRNIVSKSQHWHDAVLNLDDKILVCFGKPGPCHGDILKKVARELKDLK